MERPHIVQPVGELDQQHADIVRHGEQELAEILRGALVLGLRFDLGQLGDAVDQPRDGGAEQLLDLLDRRDGVLHRVVQDRGGDRLVVEMQLGQDAGHLDRMAEIGVARGAFLRAMGVDREDIGAVEQRLIGLRVVIEDPVYKFILAQHALRWGCEVLLCNKKLAAAVRLPRPRDLYFARALHLASASASKAVPPAVNSLSAPARCTIIWHTMVSREFVLLAVNAVSRHFHIRLLVMKLVLVGCATGVAV